MVIKSMTLQVDVSIREFKSSICCLGLKMGPFLHLVSFL